MRGLDKHFPSFDLEKGWCDMFLARPNIGSRSNGVRKISRLSVVGMADIPSRKLPHPLRILLLPEASD